MPPHLMPRDRPRRATPSSPPTSRDQALLADAGRFGLLTFRQIKRRHFDLPDRPVSPRQCTGA